MENKYKDNFTLDGRLKPQLGVTRAKVAAADRLLAEAMQGGGIAEGTLREAMTSSDLQFNMAHLVSAELIPQFDSAERVWSQIAGVRTVPSFDNVKLFSIYGDITGAGIAEDGGAVRIPEAAPYPHVTISGVEAFYNKIHKNGFRFAYTWEAAIGDVAGFFENLPSELLNVAVDTEEREVMDALINGVDKSARALQGGTLPDETVVAPNAALTPEAIWQAIIEAMNTEVRGNKIGRASGYNVIVPLGVKDFIDWKLNRAILEVIDGQVVYGPGDRSALANVTVVETPRLSGGEWYLAPKPGAVRNPVLELGRLRGYETPELRVENAAGNYAGGGAISPFEGSFTNDTIDYRFRYVAGGILWDDSFIVYSDGSGEA